jgi:hypothetical protein
MKNNVVHLHMCTLTILHVSSLIFTICNYIQIYTLFTHADKVTIFHEVPYVVFSKLMEIHSHKSRTADLQ